MDYQTFLQSLKEFSGSISTNFYLIGGFVRDKLLDMNNLTDIDIAVEYEFDQFIENFNRYFNTNPKMISRFKTAAYDIDGLSVDIITARKESYEVPGALPDITPSTLEDDIRRRDFTVNSLAMHPATGDIIDKIGGMKDLNKGIMRANRENLFTEDPTRLFRLLKYSNRLKFDIEKNTYTQMNNALENRLLFDNISKARISSEWISIMNDCGFETSLIEIYRYNIIKNIMRKDVKFNFCRLSSLDDFEKTVLIFIENDRETLIAICDKLLNGIKKTEKKSVRSLHELYHNKVMRDTGLEKRYPCLVRRIRT